MKFRDLPAMFERFLREDKLVRTCEENVALGVAFPGHDLVRARMTRDATCRTIGRFLHEHITPSPDVGGLIIGDYVLLVGPDGEDWMHVPNKIVKVEDMFEEEE